MQYINADTFMFKRDNSNSPFTYYQAMGMRVYFVRGKITGLIKIGYSSEPSKRFLSLSSVVTEPIELLKIIIGNRRSEQYLHERFARHRHHGEWFRPHPELLSFIQKVRHVKYIDSDGWLKELNIAECPDKYECLF